MNRFKILISNFLLIAIIFFLIVSFSRTQDRSPEIFAIVDEDPIYRLLPPNAIPAIMDPEYVSGMDAEKQMKPDEPVMGLVLGSKAIAYSLWQLDAHEIVNDVVDGTLIAVTW